MHPRGGRREGKKGHPHCWETREQNHTKVQGDGQADSTTSFLLSPITTPYPLPASQAPWQHTMPTMCHTGRDPEGAEGAQRSPAPLPSQPRPQPTCVGSTPCRRTLT